MKTIIIIGVVKFISLNIAEIYGGVVGRKMSEPKGARQENIKRRTKRMRMTN
jgi:hypothetical protein